MQRTPGQNNLEKLHLDPSPKSLSLHFPLLNIYYSFFLSPHLTYLYIKLFSFTQKYIKLIQFKKQHSETSAHQVMTHIWPCELERSCLVTLVSGSLQRTELRVFNMTATAGRKMCIQWSFLCVISAKIPSPGIERQLRKNAFGVPYTCIWGLGRGQGQP